MKSGRYRKQDLECLETVEKSNKYPAFGLVCLQTNLETFWKRFISLMIIRKPTAGFEPASCGSDHCSGWSHVGLLKMINV